MTIWMPVIPESNTPRYVAIADAIELAIKNQTLTAGERLPTHRAFAEHLAVTVGTITRGYAEAERRGLVSARVGSGTYVNGLQSGEDQFAILTPKTSGRINFSLNLQVASEPSQMFAEILQEIAADADTQLDLLAYQPEQGLTRQRQWALEWLKADGLEFERDQITVTCGGQHAILLALMACTRAGDTVLSEGLTYPGLNAVTHQLGLKAIGLPMDEEGIIPEAFETQCGLQKVRAVYCTPSIQNPTNAVMGLERRKAIVEIAKRHQIWVIEDQVSSGFHDKRLPPLAVLDPEHCLYINSHSKSVAAGLRVGYLVSPLRLKNQIASAIRTHCWFTPPLPVEVAQRWLSRPQTADWLGWQHDELEKRAELAKLYLGEFDCRIVQGSFNLWLLLPEPWRAMEFQSQLAEREVELLTADSFAVGRFPVPQAVRVSISSPVSLGEVEEGLKIIQSLLREAGGVHLSVF